MATPAPAASVKPRTMTRTRTAICAAVLVLYTGAAQAVSLSKRDEAVARLYGLSQFVDDECSALKMNSLAVVREGEKLGVDLHAFSNSDPLMARRAAVEAELSRDPEKSCAMAWDQYGPNGHVIPGLIMRRVLD